MRLLRILVAFTDERTGLVKRVATAELPADTPPPRPE